MALPLEGPHLATGVVTAAVPPPVKVGIFWDFENVRIPNDIKSTVAANRIRDAVIGHGQIVERRLYYDSRKLSESYTDRENLDQGGFTLVDCPARNRKETLDKKLIVDIMAFACHNAAHRNPSCVVLITSDGDYAYTLSKIRDFGVKTIVIHGPSITTAGILFHVCEHVLSFHDDVLDIRQVDEDEEEGCSEVQDALNDALGGRHVVLCHSLAELGDSWVPDSKVSKAYNRKRGFMEEGEGVGPYKTTRDSAVAGGFIQKGRKELNGGKVVESSGPWDQQSMGSQFSHYLWVRLTDTGRRQLEDNTQAAHEAMDAIQGENGYPSAGSVTPSEELPIKELRIGEAEAVAAPTNARASTSTGPASPIRADSAQPEWQTRLGQRGASAIVEAAAAPVEAAAAPTVVVEAAATEGGGADRGAGRSRAAGGGEGGGGIPSKRQLWWVARYKTTLCTRFESSGRCRYGGQCGFAHGQGELRSKPSRNVPPGRTICRDFNTTAGCHRGQSCHFLHAATENDPCL